jgi:AraC family transcriptional regulator of adaptative response/methylated-DNA-[protein]-cysteine methyltransferase
MKASKKDHAHERETLRDPRWSRIVARDKSADGEFWYSVATTGVYCRPSCPSRGAKPRNVSIHESLSAAKATGFRPCRRCNPDGLSSDAENAALVLKACRLLEEQEEAPSLAELADAVELSPYYFHRLFKKTLGVTPKAYAAECRSRRLRDGLGKAPSVTAAMYEAGFASSGRFYQVSTQTLGMQPRRYRAGGAKEVLVFAVAQCSLGAVLVASSAKGVAAVLLDDEPDALVRDLQDRFPNADFIGGDARYEALVARVVGIVERPGRPLDLPLDVRGTAFQQRVWRALRDVPAGETTTYADIAARIGAPRSARAVAATCAANKIAVAIPCHRVIRHDGTLSGYRWGIERKRILLEREGATVSARRVDRPIAS